MHFTEKIHAFNIHWVIGKEFIKWNTTFVSNIISHSLLDMPWLLSLCSTALFISTVWMERWQIFITATKLLSTKVCFQNNISWRRMCNGNFPIAIMTSSNGNIFRVTVDSPHKDQSRGALMSSSIWAWTNGLTNNGDAGDLRRHRGHHYAVTVIDSTFPFALLGKTSILVPPSTDTYLDICVNGT